MSEQSRDLDGRILRSSGWVALSYGGRHLASVLAMLVLVRLLEPEAFGLVALAWTFLVVVNQLQSSGIGSALIHRRGELDEAAASAFVFAFAASLALYGASFAAAPLLARAFDAPELADVLRVMALLLIVQSLGVVPAALLERNIDFRARTKSELSAATAQVGTSLGLAFAGFGVWSLVFGQVAAAAAQTAVLWTLAPFRPNPRHASFATLRELLRYGRFVSATNILNLLNNTLDNVVVGRLLGTGPLGLYAVAYRLADFPNTVIGHIVGRVMFPVYSMLQDRLSEFRRAYVQNLQRIALLALPASVTVVIAAEPIVLALLGERWEGMITPLRILGLYGLVKSFSAPAGEVFKGAGKPQLGAVLGLFQIAILLPALLLLVPRFGVTGAALAMLVAVTISGGPKFVIGMHVVELEARELVHALAPALWSAALLAVALAGLLVPTQSMSPPASLAILASAGFLVYLGATAVFARSLLAPAWMVLRKRPELGAQR